MSVAVDPFPAYQSRRIQIATELQHAKAKSLKEQLMEALLLSDMAVASAYDLSIALQKLGEKIHVRVDEHLIKASNAVASAKDEIQNISRSESSALAGSLLILTKVAQLQVDSSQQGINMAYLQWDVLNAIGNSWLETLDNLYSASDRSVFFARMKNLAEFAVMKIPVVGAFLEVIKLALDLAQERANQAKNANEYFASLESYIDAANLCLVGVISFCAQVESLVQGITFPSESEIQQRILDHMKSVNDRTHPASIPKLPSVH